MRQDIGKKGKIKKVEAVVSVMFPYRAPSLGCFDVFSVCAIAVPSLPQVLVFNEDVALRQSSLSAPLTNAWQGSRKRRQPGRESLSYQDKLSVELLEACSADLVAGTHLNSGRASSAQNALSKNTVSRSRSAA